jgi:DNA-binding NtrC family response regulator
MRRALLLDDEKIERSILQTILIDVGFDVRALPLSDKIAVSDDPRSFDIAILDLSASMRNESQIVSVCDALSGTAILIMTDNGTIAQALRVGVRTAALDYIKKPFSKEELLAAVERTIQHAEVLRENRALKQHQPTTRTLPEF